MRLYFRLVVLDIVALSFLFVPRLRHISKSTPAASSPMLTIVAFALMAANFVIVWRIARQGEIGWLGGSRWWSVASAWVGGPLVVAVLPFSIAAAIMRHTFQSVMWVVFYSFVAFNSFAHVYRRNDGIAPRDQPIKAEPKS
jgi:hypothetical protein